MSNTEIIEVNYLEATKGIKEEWFQTFDNKWYNYIINLPLKLQVTYLIVVLNNQVLNGGFHQYFVNGYGQFAKKTIIALVEIGAFKKAELLQEAFRLVNLENYNDEIFRVKLLTKEIDDLFLNDNLYEPLNKLDSEYYENTQEVEQLLSNYLI